MVKEIKALKALISEQYQNKNPLTEEAYNAMLRVVESLEKPQEVLKTDKKISARKMADPENPGIFVSIGNHECVVVEFNSNINEYEVVIWSDDSEEDPTHIIPLKITN